MPIELIDKIKPKNGQCFPLVEAADVEMPDGTRLSDFSRLENIDYETQIINKPFGTTPSGTVLFDKTVNCTEAQTVIDTIELVGGVTYTVEIDGTVYTGTAITDVSGVVLLSLDSELKYLIGYTGSMTILVCSVGEHAVKITLAEDVVKKIDKKYLPDNIGGGGASGSIEQTQSDYAQNDSTAKDYIKNRPFYEDEPIPTEFPLRETLLEKQTFTQDDFRLITTPTGQNYAVVEQNSFSLTEGDTYKVHWDGVDYPVTAYALSLGGYDQLWLGNQSAVTGESSELTEPFVIYQVISNGVNGIVSLTDTEATPHDVAIYKEPVFIYSEGEIAFAAGGTPSSEMLALWNSNWENCVFTWDGVEYVCEPQMLQGLKVIGNIEKLFGTGDSGEPFMMMCADASLTSVDMWMIYDLETEITDTTEVGSTVAHEVGLVINVPNIKKLDPKFLENIDYETQVINKPFDTTPSGTVLFDGTIVLIEAGEAVVDSVELVEGITYTVEIDGTVYTAVATSPEENVIYLTLDAENDYMIANVGGMTVIVYSAGEHTVKITLAEDVIKKIDKKYLPDNIGGSGLPEVTTNDNDKIIQVVDGAYQVVALEDSAIKTYIDNYIDEALGGEY